MLQSFVAILVIMIALLLHLIYLPFERKDLNMVEKYSILCAGMTIYFGLYFVEEDLVSDMVSWWFFIVVFIVNLFFCAL